MKAIICDNRISEKIERRLLIEGYYIIKLPASSSLPEAISAHPDSLIFRLGDTFVTTCDYAEEAAYVFSDIREFCHSSRIVFIDESEIFSGSCFCSAHIFNQNKKIKLKKKLK